MPLTHCPHCRAENFTVEAWADLDHCSSCGKPLAEPIRKPFDSGGFAARLSRARRRQHQGNKGQNAQKPRHA